MQFIGSVLPYLQLTLAILLIGAILLQQRGSSLGGAFGGDNMGTTFYTRRGAEKLLFQATILLGVLFACTAFITLFV
jgi:protein translocase SecG subunit